MTKATTGTWAAAALLIALAGCQTTGDPRQGGLFGWSEEKAAERQAAMTRQDSESKRAESEAKARATELGERQARLQDATTVNQRELDRLLDENNLLERQIVDLIGKRRLSESEVVRLQQVLATNQRARQSAQRSVAQAGGGSRAPTTPAPAIRPAAAQVSDQNEQLQREILLLLRR